MAVSRTFLASGAQMDIWGYTAAVIEDFVYPPQSPPVADRTKEHVCIKTGAFLDTKLEHFETLNLDDVCRRVFGIPRDLNDVGGGLNDVCRRVFATPRGLNDVGGGLNDVCRRVFGIPRGLNDIGGCLNDACRRIFGIPGGLNNVGGGLNNVCRRVFAPP